MPCLAQDREVVARDVNDLAVVAQVVPAGTVRQRCMRKREPGMGSEDVAAVEGGDRCTLHPLASKLPKSSFQFPLIPYSRSERLSSM